MLGGEPPTKSPCFEPSTAGPASATRDVAAVQDFASDAPHFNRQDRGDINAVGDRSAALFMATALGHVALCARLIERGVDVNARDHLGRTPLHIAAKNSRRSTRGIFDLLRSAGAPASDEVLAVLLRSGADVDARDDEGRAPLHFAMDDDMVVQLAAAGADVDAQNGDCETPLHFAVKQGETSVIRTLLDNGANPNAQNYRLQTPLHILAQEKPTEAALAAALLLSGGANIDARDRYSETPLHTAAQSGDTFIAQVVVENGADVNALAAGSFTALDLAAGRNRYGYRDMMRFLIRHGAAFGSVEDF